MKRKTAYIIGGSAFILAVVLTLSSLRSQPPSVVSASSLIPNMTNLVAGPGKVEPISENIQIGSELSGKLRSVNVEEGDHVHKGEIVAELQNDDYRAEVQAAVADVRGKESTLDKVLNGARPQERAEALATERQAQAVLANALSEKDRREKLYAAGVISREELDSYVRAYDVARAQYNEQAAHHSLVDAESRQEDIAFARADLQAAKANLLDAQAKYEKTLIRSPIDGVVLRKHHRNGESVSNSSTVPDPILTIGNTKTLRVRVDVDETDVSKVHLGQRAYVTADAYGKKKFWGKVVQVGEMLGPKNVFTGEPTEKVDTKILETLVQLEPGTELPVGLRVDAYILENGGEMAESQRPGQ